MEKSKIWNHFTIRKLLKKVKLSFGSKSNSKNLFHYEKSFLLQQNLANPPLWCIHTYMQTFENPSSRFGIESINRWLDFFWRRRIFNPRLTSRKITCHLFWFRSRIFHRIDYCKYYFTIFLIEIDSIWFNNQIKRQLGVTTPFNVSNHCLYTSVTESNCISMFFLAKLWIRFIFDCLFPKS